MSHPGAAGTVEQGLVHSVKREVRSPSSQLRVFVTSLPKASVRIVEGRVTTDKEFKTIESSESLVLAFFTNEPHYPLSRIFTLTLKRFCLNAIEWRRHEIINSDRSQTLTNIFIGSEHSHTDFFRPSSFANEPRLGEPTTFIDAIKSNTCLQCVVAFAKMKHFIEQIPFIFRHLGYTHTAH